MRGGAPCLQRTVWSRSNAFSTDSELECRDHIWRARRRPLPQPVSPTRIELTRPDVSSVARLDRSRGKYQPRRHD